MLLKSHHKVTLSLITLSIIVTDNVLADTTAVPFKNKELAILASPDQLPDHKIIKFMPQSGISVISVESGKELAMLAKLRNQGHRGGLNRLATKFTVPNDPYSGLQWHFNAIQAPAAWDITQGEGVTIAVLDTGLKQGGNDGVGCVVFPIDIVNNDADPSDGDGHGTHVSGTINQSTGNNIGVAGLAYGGCIMPVKVLDDSGSGSFADISEGIYHAVNNGAKVINMSLGVNARFGLRNDPVLDPALDYAYNNGVTVVAASGNDGHRKNVSYPAIYPTTLAVGATDYRNRVTRYSNKGEGLDIVAPGGDTGKDDNNDGFADGVLQETFIDGSWSYWFFQGTSMATPHVAAVAALLIANGNAVSPDDVRSALQQSALDIGDPGVDNASAHGLVQAKTALEWDSSLLPPPDDETGTSCTDADGDGVCWEDGDCDDSNPSIYPGFNEKGRRSRDGLDNDCNGVIDG